MEMKKYKYNKGGEFKDDTPKIYVADLKSYNEGRLVGEWVDLTDYDSGEEVSDKIASLMKEYSKKYHNGEETEHSIHDYENFDSSLYSEYMGEKDYDIIIDTHKISEEKGIPAEVLQSIANDFSPDNLEEFVDDRYIGQYDGDYELGENYVDNVGGIEGVSNPEFYFDYEALGRDLSINNYNEYDGHYFQNYKKGGTVKEYDLSKYAKGGSLGNDLSGNYTSTDDFVSENGLIDSAKQKFGDDWQSGGDYDYDVEEIKVLAGDNYKVIFVDSERQNRDNFEEAKQKYFPKMKYKSNDGDIFVIRSFEKGGDLDENKEYIIRVYNNEDDYDFDENYDVVYLDDEAPNKKRAISKAREIEDSNTWVRVVDNASRYNDEIYSSKFPQGFAEGGETISREKIVEVLKDELEDVLEDANQEYEGQEIKGEEVEYESRDGFIPFTDGGYEYRFFTYGNYLTGSGKSLPTNTLDAELERVENLNYEYGKERFAEEYPEIVKELGEENIDYNSLSEAGYDSEADDLDEFSRSDDDSIMFEVEAFYYNPDNSRGIDGKHTIVLTGNVNMEAPYHRTGNMEDYTQDKFTFDSIEDLKEKLQKGIDKISKWFDGDNYKEGRELKIGRFAKGGSVKKELEGYQGMYDYAIANNFTPSQLADELEFSTGLKDERDKKFYAHLKNLTRMFPDKPLSEFAKGGRIEITSAPEYHKVRNKEYDKRVKEGKMKDTDENFEKFDDEYFNELVKKGEIDMDNYFAKGGEVKKKGDNSMLIGGLAGILLGIFLGRK
jgi:antirestriction protein